jgi:hypothetical protein
LSLRDGGGEAGAAVSAVGGFGLNAGRCSCLLQRR